MATSPDPPVERFVFDRSRSKHPWSEAIGELRGGTDEAREAIARNWQMDHRVAEARETELTSDPRLPEGASGEEWMTGIWDHWATNVCRPAFPADGLPGCPTWAGSNLGNHLPRIMIPTWQELLHAGSFFNILRFLGRGMTDEARVAQRKFEGVTGETFPGAAPGGSISFADFSAQAGELARRINRKGEETVRELAQVLCDGLGATEPPWWATFAEELAPLLDAGNATGLCQALGLGHLEAGDWLIVWRYPIDAIEDSRRPPVGSVLARPTVVEAAHNPWHFPSPPASLVGITMPLSESEDRAFREVLHVPLRGPVSATACTGELLEIQAPPVDRARLVPLRRRHQEHLERDSPSDEVSSWIRRHTL